MVKEKEVKSRHREVVRIGNTIIRSNFPIRRVSDNVHTTEDEYWTHFHRLLPKSYREMWEAQTITGKYLFFSEDRNKLVKIAMEELERNGFQEAKVNTEGNKIGSEYVLCLYYKDDSRQHELAEKYAQTSGIKYRYWKTDRDTLSGKYSEEFLSKLKPKQRKEFTASKLETRRGE